jgi:hypothetical protein
MSLHLHFICIPERSSVHHPYGLMRTVVFKIFCLLVDTSIMKATTQLNRHTNTQLTRNRETKFAPLACSQIARGCSILDNIQRPYKQALRLSGIRLLVCLVASTVVGTSAVAAETMTLKVQILGSEVQGDTTLRVTQNSSVAIIFTSDTAIALHLHGYDVEALIEPGEPTTMKLDARIAGRFPMEVHGHTHGKSNHRALLYLEVYPR